MATASPTVARRALAKLLRHRREEAGKTAAQAADYVGMHAATLSRVESATTRIQPGTAQALMRYYGASEDEIAAVFELAHAARQRGWWQKYKDIPAWLDAYIGLETDAETLRSYEVELIHGLLQTEDYAFALAKAGIDVPSDDLARRHASLRMARQKRLIDAKLHLHAIMSEAALYREVGGPQVMRDQLHQLKVRMALPNVTCQILPFGSGAHASTAGAFAILTFPPSPPPEVAISDVVYVEYGLGALYLEDSSDLHHYRQIFDDLSRRALDPEESVKLVERALSV
ncbi:helix-turn-helix domain-containing protein [Thermobifida cellulosilytica]|uniref:HTH cro/C1-type domain-containing protein n=1 Tax=Thermobifida cellulosilytica TB100 TaxID=665004 RepID=A0A147KF45_THECS|nr:helix-turn-helix transcriptional regulator [Thermobifida cellulosilytica]KUP95859.1 hypothetical protein AC529_15305 [Thermobifida cellulosilytica TB100]